MFVLCAYIYLIWKFFSLFLDVSACTPAVLNGGQFCLTGDI